MSTTASAIVTIRNRLGLHARPAMLFVKVATDFEAEIVVRRADQTEAVDGKAIMQMMMLAATQGTDLEITATGSDADRAIARLSQLVEERFDED